METKETKMYRLKTITGVPYRKLFQAFEWEALMYADSNNLQKGEIFTYGKSGESFCVRENDNDVISVFREKNEKLIEAFKVYTGKIKVETENAETENTGNNNTENEHMETTESKKVENESVEVSTNEVSTNNNNVNVNNNVNNNNDVVMAAFANLQNALLNNQPKSNIDMEEVKKFVIEQVEKARTINIKINDVPTFKTEGVLHDKFEYVLSWLSQGQEYPVYLFGPAGTGKNVLAEQVAKAMKLPFYYAGCLQQKYELEGFINATGEYQETELYKAFTEGGVFLFDEIDGTAAEVLVAFNSILANGYYNFPKHGKIEAHKDFRVIAAGNTAGRGANETYNGRFQLDASTLDRFVFIELDYSEKIELQNANGNAELVEFAHELRKEIEKQGLTYTFSTRAIKRLTIAEAMGMNIKTALQQSLCGGWAKEDITLLQNNVRYSSNKYAKAFCNVKVL